ncbi:MAG: 2Fe-2S iron-sulfur cluster-binding protein [Gammaproteobacteria bacterium]|nr:2Fe-2S iron-sulfur cluster-binding protein [Gammaproteobacteria bacterium]
MTHRIRMLPSGHTFECEATETVLEAALRSGVNLDHGCATGTCGECLARVVSGTVGEELFHDYVVGDARRQQGYALMCRSRPGSDLEIEAHEARGAGDIPEQQLMARVVRVDAPADDYRVLHLRTPRTRTLRFLAGQSVELKLGGLAPRRLPVASCPCNGMQLQFHLRRDAGDPFAERIFHDGAFADPVELRGPFGEFILDEEQRNPLVLVALDTGFAPMKSLIEHAIALELAQPVVLIWFAARPGGHYLANYCRSWADALDDFRYVPLVLDAGRGGPPVPPEQAQAVLERLESLPEPRVYLAGPAEPARELARALVDTGLPGDRLRVEAMS